MAKPSWIRSFSLHFYHIYQYSIWIRIALGVPTSFLIYNTFAMPDSVMESTNKLSLCSCPDKKEILLYLFTTCVSYPTMSFNLMSDSWNLLSGSTLENLKHSISYTIRRWYLLLLPFWDWILLARAFSPQSPQYVRMIVISCFFTNTLFIIIHIILYMGSPDPGYGLFKKCQRLSSTETYYKGEKYCHSLNSEKSKEYQACFCHSIHTDSKSNCVGYLVNDIGLYDGLSIKNNNSICSICWEEFSEGEATRKLRCEHTFHDQCVRQWWQRSDTCPLCRQECYSYTFNSIDYFHTLTMEDWEIFMYFLALLAIFLVFPIHIKYF